MVELEVKLEAQESRAEKLKADLHTLCGLIGVLKFRIGPNLVSTMFITL